ncbi:unnamed protein product [Macrosiphum euphorbiae]|uniref:Tudor domain-containing protein n=1 Tax=Macrosiphum euphorbiae TaxID=13131 RepID=A0AAV0XBK0_9HEMI|nr:unnamed protein product [Macrosiphum euphorbiae]
MFFVKNTKHYDRLNNLQLMIDKYIEEKQLNKLNDVINGAICLAKYPHTNKYNRVKIIEKFDNGDVEVLFVDTGEFIYIKFHLLLTIHPDLITYLPFQAIECSLSGVKDTLPTGNELNELTDYLFDMTQNPLYLKVINTISSTTFTGGSHYEVILFDAEITVNLEFQTKFSQYCDTLEMSKLLNCINTEYYNEDICEEDNANIPYVIDEKNLEIEDDFASEILTSIFGKEFANSFKCIDQNIEDVKKEESLSITDVKPITESGPLKDCITVEPIKTQEIIPISNAVMLKDKSVQDNSKQKLREKRRNICLTCNTNIQSIIPICTWHQDRNNIYLKLNILEIDDFSVDSTLESIKFKSRFKHFAYEFCVRLYGFIIDKSITHRHNYEGFQIKAEKLYKTDYKWPQLFSCSKRHTYVKYDTNHIEIKDLTIWEKAMNKFKLSAKGTPLNSINDEYSSSEGEDEEHIDFDDSIDDY